MSSSAVANRKSGYPNLRLESQEPGGRLESAKLLGSDAMTVRIALHRSDDVDDEVVELLRRAYAANM